MVDIQRIKESWKAIALSIIILGLVVLVPYMYVYNTGYTGRHTGVIRLESGNASWFNSTAEFSCEDGYVEILHFQTPSPWPGSWDPEPVIVNMGLQVDYEFTLAQQCFLEFACPALNLNLGSFQFQSDTDTILYSDEDGNQISWSVMLVYDFER